MEWAQDNNVTTKGSSKLVVILTKDKKIMSQAQCSPPIPMSPIWNITTTIRKDKIVCLSELPGFPLYLTWQDHDQEKECRTFFDFLRNKKEVAALELGSYQVYILPPSDELKWDSATVRYMALSKRKPPLSRCNGRDKSATSESIPDRFSAEQLRPEAFEYSFDRMDKGTHPSAYSELSSSCPENNVARTHPAYLKTLSQAHSSWIFGAIAELVDNSRDAQSTRLEVGISMVKSKTSGKKIPMLGVIDDGQGMIHFKSSKNDTVWAWTTQSL